MVFLWRIRWHAAIASIGGLLTLLALIMDPFAQQIISYSTELAPAPAAVALLPVARDFVIRARYATPLGWNRLVSSL